MHITLLDERANLLGANNRVVRFNCAAATV